MVINDKERNLDPYTLNDDSSDLSSEPETINDLCVRFWEDEVIEGQNFATLLSQLKHTKVPEFQVKWDKTVTQELLLSLLEPYGLSLPLSRLILHRVVRDSNYLLLAILLNSSQRDLINSFDLENKTPLHLALINCDFLAVQLLLAVPPAASQMCSSNGGFSCSQNNSNPEPENHPESWTIDTNIYDCADVTINFNHLPAVHLPLACTEESKIIKTYSLLIPYINMLRSFTNDSAEKESLVHDIFKTLGWTPEAMTVVLSKTFTHHPPSHFWDINAADTLGQTALHRACFFGYAKVINYLIAWGADSKIKDFYGNLPLIYAIDSKDVMSFAIMCGHTFSEKPYLVNSEFVVKRCIQKAAWKCLYYYITNIGVGEIKNEDDLISYAEINGFSVEFDKVYKKKLKFQRNRIQFASIHTSGVPITFLLVNLMLRRKKIYQKFPENATRLHTLLNKNLLGFKLPFLTNLYARNRCRLISPVEILRVHEWSYIKKLLDMVKSIQRVETDSEDTSDYLIKTLDHDTPITAGTWSAAHGAASSVIAAVDAVCSGEFRSCFCVIRPPGHHAGIWGSCQLPSSTPEINVVSQEDWIEGSQGFCLLNNVAIGAAHARFTYGTQNIRRIAIVDFDIHHGNGTEQIIRNLYPRTRHINLNGFNTGHGNINLQYSEEYWKPWWNESDSEDIFFASIHGFAENFYPRTGAFDEVPTIRNVPVYAGTSQEMFQNLFVNDIIKPTARFHPDIIFISAGFDAHYLDLVGTTFGGCTEYDYAWMTQYIVALANECCDGRIVSVLEGGYNVKGGVLSPLALSVSAHVRSLLDTSPELKLAGMGFVSPPKIVHVPVCKDDENTNKRRKRRAAAEKALKHIAQKIMYDEK